MKFFTKSLLAAAAITASLSAQAVILIDDFTDPVAPADQTVTDVRFTNGVGNGTVGVGSSLSSVNVIGGQRDLFVIESDVVAGSTIIRADGSTGVRAVVENGVYTFSSDANQAGVGIIRWDGSNTDFGQSATDSVQQNVLNAIGSVSSTGFTAQNFSGSATGFNITVLQADAGFPFTLFAYSGTNASVVSEIALQTTAGSPNTFYIPFSGFVTLAGTGADFTAITALQAAINFPGDAVSNVDLTVDLVQIVPEPGSVALVGAALLGLGAIRRRKSAK